jgi:hypothetical protein
MPNSRWANGQRIYRSVPALERADRLVADLSLRQHEPVDTITVRAAAEAMEVIVVDVKARRTVGMKGTIDLAVAERLANQVGERDRFGRLRALQSPACGICRKFESHLL